MEDIPLPGVCRLARVLQLGGRAIELRLPLGQQLQIVAAVVHQLCRHQHLPLFEIRYLRAPSDQSVDLCVSSPS